MRTSPDRPNWRAALWLRRRRILGRRRFIWGWVVPRLALPAAALATALRALTERFAWGHFLAHLVVNVLGAGVLGGYIAGRLLWELLVVSDRRRRAARGRETLRRRAARDPGPSDTSRPRSRDGSDPRG